MSGPKARRRSSTWSGARSLRVFGSAHSFNGGVVADEVLVSLDAYAGSRQRPGRAADHRQSRHPRPDVVRLLAERGPGVQGFAVARCAEHGRHTLHRRARHGEVLGIHQRVGGRADRGRRNGDRASVGPSDDLFRAAIGGIGAVGIITEVVVQGVPRFNVDQRTEIKDLSWVRATPGRAASRQRSSEPVPVPVHRPLPGQHLEPHDANRPPRRRNVREFVNISLDALLAAWVGNFLAYTRLLPLSRLLVTARLLDQARVESGPGE